MIALQLLFFSFWHSDFFRPGPTNCIQFCRRISIRSVHVRASFVVVELGMQDLIIRLTILTIDQTESTWSGY